MLYIMPVEQYGSFKIHLIPNYTEKSWNSLLLSNFNFSTLNSINDDENGMHALRQICS